MLIAIIAFAGIFNCTVIEPAFAWREDASACQKETETHCCFICHSAHHPLVPLQAEVNLQVPVLTHTFLPFSSELNLEAPVNSIFHVPISL